MNIFSGKRILFHFNFGLWTHVSSTVKKSYCDQNETQKKKKLMSILILKILYDKCCIWLNNFIKHKPLISEVWEALLVIIGMP